MKKNKSKKILVKIFIMTLMFAFLSFGLKSWYVQNHEESVLHYGIIDPGIAIDLYLSKHTDIATIYRHVIEPLYMVDESNYEIIPLLTKDLPDISVDGLTYTFTLKPSIYFHNGSQLSSYDVQFMFERMFSSKELIVIQELYKNIAGAKDMIDGRSKSLSGFKVIDNLRFVISLDQPDALFLMNLTHPYAGIYSKKAYLEAPYQWGSIHLVGSGPYKFEKYQVQQFVILKHFSRYHGEIPAIKHLHFLFFEDNQTILEAYQKNFLEIAPLPFYYYRKYLEEPLVNLKEITHHNFIGNVSLVFNMDDPILGNVLVRKAIALAIDNDYLAQNYFNGLGKTVYNHLPYFISGSSSDQLTPSKNIELAKEALTQAGYPNGLQLVVYYHSIDNEGLWKTIQEQLKEIGINLYLLKYHTVDWYHRMNNGELNILLVNWVATLPDADDLLFSIFHSSQSKQWSLNYRNQQVDNWLAEARNTHDDQKREMLYQAVEKKVIQEELAVLPLVDVPNLYLVKDNLFYEPSFKRYHLFHKAYFLHK